MYHCCDDWETSSQSVIQVYNIQVQFTIKVLIGGLYSVSACLNLAACRSYSHLFLENLIIEERHVPRCSRLNDSLAPKCVCPTLE